MVAMAAAMVIIMEVAMAGVMAVIIMVAMAVIIMVAMAGVMAIIMAWAMVVILMAGVIMNLKNLPEQRDGKIEVMGTLLKTLNMKVVEAGEEEEFQMRVTYQMRRISNPFLLV